jgi:hypothetical protein
MHLPETATPTRGDIPKGPGSGTNAASAPPRPALINSLRDRVVVALSCSPLLAVGDRRISEGSNGVSILRDVPLFLAMHSDLTLQSRHPKSFCPWPAEVSVNNGAITHLGRDVTLKLPFTCLCNQDRHNQDATTSMSGAIRLTCWLRNWRWEPIRRRSTHPPTPWAWSCAGHSDGIRR